MTEAPIRTIPKTETRSRADNGSGVDSDRIPEDISIEIRRDLAESGPPKI